MTEQFSQRAKNIDKNALDSGGPRRGYADVNGLHMYYEIHNPDTQLTDVPLVLLHGAFSATGTSFEMLLPALTENRTVISIEQQGHGHTNDIDRPITIHHMAEDTIAALFSIGVRQADFMGYSMGSGIALDITIKHPELVRKLVLVSLAYTFDGFHPGLIEGMEGLQPEMLVGSPFHDEYMRSSPNPDNFPTLVEKVKGMNRADKGWTAEMVRAIKAPTLLIMGDSDIVRPEHGVEMFRLLGGGVAGDNMGLPNSQLAILPGTTHVTVVNKANWVTSMVEQFLNLPMPEGS